jgi:hypothetical protein
MTTQPTASRDHFAYELECRGCLQAPQGLLSLRGWAATVAEPALQVRLRLDNGGLFECHAGLERSDVAAAYPQLRGALTSGFSLEAYLPLGLHLGTLEYCFPGAETWVPFRSFSILSAASPLLFQLETTVPPDGQRTTWPLHGWCFHPQSEIEDLSVHFGAVAASLTHGLPRPDVASLYSWNATALHSGFSGSLELGPGRGDAVLIARLRNGTTVLQPIARELSIAEVTSSQAIP